MIENVREKLFIKNLKLKSENKILRQQVVALKNENEELKKINYETGSNLNYLIEQRRKKNKKIRELKRELEELKQSKGEK